MLSTPKNTLFTTYTFGRHTKPQIYAFSTYTFGSIMVSVSMGEYKYGFMKFEKDDEIIGSGNSIDAGARILDTRLGKRFAIDPPFAKYPSLSPYALTANNPIWFYEVDGRVIDVSNLTTDQRKTYEAQIKVLSQSKLFATYYRRLQNSETVYTINPGDGHVRSGSFNPATGEVHAVLNSTYIISQELFHAYQSDLGVYDSKDLSVRETEGDLVSSNIQMELGLLSREGIWDQGIGFNDDYVDENLAFDEGVLTESFNNDFSKVVDARIEYYKNTSKEKGVDAPKTYVGQNSGKAPLALQKTVREKSAESLVGPRLENGDFYAE